MAKPSATFAAFTTFFRGGRGEFVGVPCKQHLREYAQGLAEAVAIDRVTDRPVGRARG